DLLPRPPHPLHLRRPLPRHVRLQRGRPRARRRLPRALRPRARGDAAALRRPARRVSGTAQRAPCSCSRYLRARAVLTWSTAPLTFSKGVPFIGPSASASAWVVTTVPGGTSRPGGTSTPITSARGATTDPAPTLALKTWACMPTKVLSPIHAGP